MWKTSNDSNVENQWFVHHNVTINKLLQKEMRHTNMHN